MTCLGSNHILFLFDFAFAVLYPLFVDPRFKSHLKIKETMIFGCNISLNQNIPKANDNMCVCEYILRYMLESGNHCFNCSTVAVYIWVSVSECIERRDGILWGCFVCAHCNAFIVWYFGIVTFGGILRSTFTV